MNVLYIIADQYIASCMGCAGHPQAITPHLDRLASQGTRFERAYCQNPICTPSRMSILSGQYVHNFGYYGLGGPRPAQLPTFMGHFQRHGYRTAGIGKLHLPNDPDFWARDDLDFLADCYHSPKNAAPGELNAYRAYLREQGLEEAYQADSAGAWGGDAASFEGRPAQVPYEHSIEGWAVREAMRWIAADRSTPFCMQVSLPKPHTPIVPAERFWKLYPDDLALPHTYGSDVSHRAPHFAEKVPRFAAMTTSDGRDGETLARLNWHGYLACVSQVDFAVGELLDFLEQNGLQEETIVIYGADHGAYAGHYGLLEKSPGICADLVCRVPFLWRVPGVTHPDARSQQLVENVDIAPTIAALCALPPLEWTDGRDLSPLLRGEATPIREIAVTENAGTKALRWENWRFVHYQRELFGREWGELYDLEADPDETRNLFFEPEHQGVVNECRRRLLEWLIGTTRIVTSQPPVPELPLALDGKQANPGGTAHNIALGGWRREYL